jgi:CelD/BcsL family acetyltransferase involved in cellulose biosynthesis
LKSDWSGLFDASPRAATPLHFDWMRTWWRVYGPCDGGRGGGLRVVTVWRGPQLVGVLPLYQARTGGAGVGVRRLRFLSTGEAEDEETCPNNLDLLCRPGEEAACAAAVRGALATASWDHLDLTDLPETAPLLADGGLTAGGRTRVVPRGECSVANLGGGFEAYLQRLSASNRRQARRLIRDAEKCGAVFEVAGEQQVEEFFDDLVRLHQERWVADGKPGCFAAPRFTEFHRTLAREWVPGGRAVLARLSVAGESAAVLYGFLSHAKFDLYVSGVRTAVPGVRSPGILAFLTQMRAMAEQGVEWYDFLRGPAPYKDQLATDQNRLVSVEAWRPTLRAAASRFAGLARRALGRVRRLGRTTSPPPGHEAPKAAPHDP